MQSQMMPTHMVPPHMMSKKKDFNKKLRHSAWAALVFVIVSLPQVYNVTNSVLPTAINGCPTPVGLLLHTLVFFAVLFFIMKTVTLRDTHKPSGLLAKYAFWSALIFFFLSSREMYAVTGSVISGLADSNGCPTLTGVLVHGLVYVAVLVAVMYFPKDISDHVMHHQEENMYVDDEDM
jgi:hypothetical protein